LDRFDSLSWLFGRRGLSELITCMVSAENGKWTVIWVSDGKAPAEFAAKSLTEAVNRATQMVAALYSAKPQAATAELQFAIYPWPGGGKVILDVQPSIDGFTATALDNSQSASGPDLESLVGQVEQSLPDFRTAMFRWIRCVRELDSSPSAS
jgi:hypothetical protein